MNFIDKVDNILSLFSDFWVKRDDEIKKKILSVIESIEKESIKECIENIGFFQCKYDDNIPVDFDHMGSVFALESYFKVYSLVKFDKDYYKSIIFATKLISNLVEETNLETFNIKKGSYKTIYIERTIKEIYEKFHPEKFEKVYKLLNRNKNKDEFGKAIRLFEVIFDGVSILDIFDKDYDYINIDEFIKYIKRIERYGEYKDLKAKEKAIFKIFNPPIETSKKYEITEYKYRDTMTSDYSDRMKYILKILKLSGDKQNPASITKNNFTVYKMGNALDDSDIELFYYLIGELEEHGCSGEITFRKSDFINNMNYKSIRGQKLDNLTSSLMNLNTQSIAIVDERKDKVGNKLQKIDKRRVKGTQLISIEFKTINKDGDEILIHIKSPFSKYFKQQGQFGRILSKNMLNNHLFKNPRILKIARELSKMIYINSQKNKKINQLEINYNTLIKNIEQEERYKSYQNKRLFLANLNKDIEQAIKYIKNTKGEYKFELIKPTPTTIMNGKIKMLKCS